MVNSSQLNLAILFEEKLNRREEAEELYIKGKSLVEVKIGKNNITYASLANNLAEYYEENNQLEKAASLYQEAKDILLDIVGKYDFGYASVIYNLAFLQKKLGNLALAEQYLLEVDEIDRATIGKHHPYYVDGTLPTLAEFYDTKNEVEKAINFYRRANMGRLDLINYYYSTFDEQTRLNFLNEMEGNFDQYFSFLHRRASQDISFVDAQNINIQLKGLAFNIKFFCFFSSIEFFLK